MPARRHTDAGSARAGRRAAPLALLAGLTLLFPAAAEAATVAVENGRATYRAGPGETDDVLVRGPLHFTNLGVTVVAFTPQNATPIGPGSGCGTFQATSVSCPVIPIELSLLDGDDRAVLSDTGIGNPAMVLAGPGDDQVTLSDAEGPTIVSGGEGTDTATIGLAGEVSLGETPADSGGYDIRSDVENLVGSDGDDGLVGNGGANRIEGRGGNDRINAGAGADLVAGGAGDDAIDSQDGVGEAVDCGAGADSVHPDPADTLSGCELIVDVDNDGVSAPADCDDRSPAVRPGAPEVPDNGIDENCDGRDLVEDDRDRDGSKRPRDCDDADAAIRPGARDVPGNGVDEDCDGGDDPFPVVRAAVFLTTRFDRATRTTTLLALRVTGLGGGDVVRTACRGRGCRPRLSRSVRLRRRTRSLDLGRTVRGTRLRPRARLLVTISHPGRIARQYAFTMLRRGASGPRRTIRCRAPGGRLRRC